MATYQTGGGTSTRVDARSVVFTLSGGKSFEYRSGSTPVNSEFAAESLREQVTQYIAQLQAAIATTRDPARLSALQTTLNQSQAALPLLTPNGAVARQITQDNEASRTPIPPVVEVPPPPRAPTPPPVTAPAPVPTPTPAPTPSPAPTAFRPAPVDTPIVRVDPNDFIGTGAPITAPPPIDSSLEGSPEFQAQSAAATITDEPLAISVLSDEALATPVIDQAALEQIAADASSQVAEAIAQIPFQPRADWRVRLSLSDDPSVNYLYKAPNPGILKPLNATNGVLFPYTPQISVNYAANYNPTDLVHSNYKVYQYSNSSIDSISITCEFTAQDEYEANYLLAVIHFFRSATKMFYGQDQNPRRGTPPPLCYIYGMGSYQFAGQPLAISGFNYNLPNNVDYIQTTVGGTNPSTAAATNPPDRTAGTGVSPGGVPPPPQFAPIAEPNSVSWVPSKIQLSVSCVPMMSRNQVSNEFSFEKYATGTLLNGVYSQTGGFW